MNLQGSKNKHPNYMAVVTYFDHVCPGSIGYKYYSNYVKRGGYKS